MDNGHTSQSDQECGPFRRLGALVSEWMFLTKVAPLGMSHLFERPGMCSSTASMEGKTVIVTGATSGIGLETAMELARRKARVILACRDVEKANAVAQLIHDETKQTAVVKRLVLDSFESVREFCDDVNRSEDRLDVLINNAGLLNNSLELTYTKDGFETCFQANHLSAVLLTLMLLEKLRKSAPSRIVNVSSDSHCNGDVSQLEAKARGTCTLHTPFAVYSNSKLAMCLYTVALADKIKNTGVTVNSLNPGLVRTPIGTQGSLLRKLILRAAWGMKGKTPVEGAQTTIQLAVDPALEKTTGEYFEECVPAKKRYRNPLLKDRALAEDVFRASVKLVGFDQQRLENAIGSP